MYEIFLTFPKEIEIYNDTGFSLIDLLDRGSLKYLSESVYESVVIMYEIFIKIENDSSLSKIFYESSCRKNLIQLAILDVEQKHSEIWRGWCVCMTSKWEMLNILFTTVANCILSKKVRNFNDIVVGRDNTKLQKFSS